jgi:adenosylmethionine-8-amino-7-oxononanoate aminotransferase
MTPLPKAHNAYLELVEMAYDRGLIIYSRRTRGGVEGDHFLVCPPLIVTEAQIDEIMTILVDSLDALAAKFDLPVSAP